MRLTGYSADPNGHATDRTHGFPIAHGPIPGGWVAFTNLPDGTHVDRRSTRSADAAIRAVVRGVNIATGRPWLNDPAWRAARDRKESEDRADMLAGRGAYQWPRPA